MRLVPSVKEILRRRQSVGEKNTAIPQCDTGEGSTSERGGESISQEWMHISSDRADISIRWDNVYPDRFPHELGEHFNSHGSWLRVSLIA